MHSEILEQRTGLFGKISIIRNRHLSLLFMKINQEIEGKVFIDDKGTPGPIAASPYLYGFIIPAWHFPKTHALMLGLGAGAGASMLLTLFPELTLTVIEMDPDVIQLTRKFFPSIHYYEKQNRLNIIASDAEDFLNTSHEKFGFILLDIFCGDENDHKNRELLNKALSRAPYFMANLITNSEKIVTDVSDLLWIRASANSPYPREKSNYLLTNMRQFSPDMIDIKLFEKETLNHAAIHAGRQYFGYILSQIQASCFY